MNTAELDYDLPRELIAQHPAPERDGSRLMVVRRGSGEISHHTFRDIGTFMEEGDLLILNDTKVLPARLQLTRSTGGRVDVVLVKEEEPGCWFSMLNCRGRLSEGEMLLLPDGTEAATVGLRDNEFTRITFADGLDSKSVMAQWGGAPLPPYIKRDAQHRQEDDDIARYQTVFARKPGSVAAPTAGLHFTEALLESLRGQGVTIAPVTLHVGAGTFLPVKSDTIEEHRMHREYYRIPEETARTVAAARDASHRVVSVGTTACRTLEAAADTGKGEGWTELFITPPYEFRTVDVLLTNFHLPRSTLLLLVYAFAGTELMRSAYEEAIREEYRFYSYGDAMLIVGG